MIVRGVTHDSGLAEEEAAHASAREWLDEALSGGARVAFCWVVLLAPLAAGGNLVNDAHLAALAIEHRCAVVSYDTDFLRFRGVKLETPPT